jgi:hypothetical protein
VLLAHPAEPFPVLIRALADAVARCAQVSGRSASVAGKL